MVRRSQWQPAHRLQNLYCDALDAIMRERNIVPSQHQPNPVVQANAGFMEVFRNADWYCRRGDSRPHYRLLAVDAENWPGAFAHGWSALLTSLTAAGIAHKLCSVHRTSINDDSRAKIALLSRAGRQEG